ncbi:MAG: sugar ABC transporter permease [Elusimicrobiota bacterium]|nr:sugar ABC transporter permease [Elusimicrobiota bacterium]
MRDSSKAGAVDWLYVAPALLVMGVVSLLPIFETFRLAGEYHRLAVDTRFWPVMRTTLSLTVVTVALELLLGLVMALVLWSPFAGRGLVRAAVLIPWALPTAVMAMAWRWIFNADYGVMGDLLFRAGLTASPQVAWLADASSAYWAIVLADVWKTTPFMAVLLMSGLAAIPGELYEAAAIDGAGPVRRFFMVTLPLLRPTIAVAVVFRAISAFGLFDLVYVLTGGGPGGRTQTLSVYIYDVVFRYQELAYGCALTVAMAGVLVLLAAALLSLTRREEPR